MLLPRCIIFSNNSSLWCLTCYGLPMCLPNMVITCRRIDWIKRVCSEPPCCPGVFSDLSSVHDVTHMRKSAPGQSVFKSTCRLKGGRQRKVWPIAWASDIAILTYPAGKWSFVGNLSYRRTVSTPGNEFFFWQGGGGAEGEGKGELVEMNFALKHTSYSLLVWEAVKLTAFAPSWEGQGTNQLVNGTLLKDPAQWLERPTSI